MILLRNLVTKSTIMGAVVITLCFLATTRTGLTALPMAHAASSPLVVVARDLTSTSHCQLSTTIVESHSISYLPCPAGTVIGTTIISQAEAVAYHEAYILLPARNASLAAQFTTKQAIEHLVDTLRDAIVGKSNPQAAIVPYFSNCGQQLTRMASYTINGWNGGPVIITATINYNMAPQQSGCNNVTLNYGKANRTGDFDGANVYWESAQYAGSQWNVPNNGGYPYIGGYQLNINSTHSAGYWYQETFCSGSNCTIFDNTITINYLLLNGN